jgi:hypothetical protein
MRLSRVRSGLSGWRFCVDAPGFAPGRSARQEWQGSAFVRVRSGVRSKERFRSTMLCLSKTKRTDANAAQNRQAWRAGPSRVASPETPCITAFVLLFQTTSRWAVARMMSDAQVAVFVSRFQLASVPFGRCATAARIRRRGSAAAAFSAWPCEFVLGQRGDDDARADRVEPGAALASTNGLGHYAQRVASLRDLVGVERVCDLAGLKEREAE